MRRTIVFFFLLALAAAGTPVFASDKGEGLGPSLDFKFMELRQRLREHPAGEQALHDHFAIGEYYFKNNMLSLAAESFGHLSVSEPKSSEELLAAVYLVRCALMTQDEKNAALGEAKLQDALSSSQFVATFRADREREWKSPLGNRYVLREKVDRLEITLNDKPFYTVDLS